MWLMPSLTSAHVTFLRPTAAIAAVVCRPPALQRPSRRCGPIASPPSIARHAPTPVCQARPARLAAHSSRHAAAWAQTPSSQWQFSVQPTLFLPPPLPPLLPLLLPLYSHSHSHSHSRSHSHSHSHSHSFALPSGRLQADGLTGRRWQTLNRRRNHRPLGRVVSVQARPACARDAVRALAAVWRLAALPASAAATRWLGAV